MSIFEQKTFVYVITNLLNKHRYVGITFDPKRRWGQHVVSARKQECQFVICKAFRKYGIENFKFEIIEEYSSREEANNEEIRLISLWKPEYNRTTGGESGSLLEEARKRLSESQKKRLQSPELRARISNNFKRWYASPEAIETKKEMSRRARERNWTDESRLKNSESQKKRFRENPSPFKGKSHTEEVRKRMSASHKGKQIPTEVKN